MNCELQITKQEYEYLVYMLLVKIIAFLSIKYEYLKKEEITNIVEELNIFFNRGHLFHESNIIQLGKELIDANFPHFLRQMKKHIINPEIILSEDKFNQIQNNLENDKKSFNFINRGDGLSDYANGKYYRFFRNTREFTERYNSSTTDICAGETLYHSFARFYAEGIDEYFNYFKQMSDCNLINYQNQTQENGFCDRIPCYYWFLNSKKDLEYFNELLKTKSIKLNYIGGNEHGPSALSLIMNMLQNSSYWDRRKKLQTALGTDFRNTLLMTFFNIVTSNYSISYDSNKLLQFFAVFNEEYYVKKAMEYIISDVGIKRQVENNKFSIIRGGNIDFTYNECRLNKELDSIIVSIKHLTKK